MGTCQNQDVLQLVTIRLINVEVETLVTCGFMVKERFTIIELTDSQQGSVGRSISVL